MPKLQLEKDVQVPEGVYCTLAEVADEVVGWLWLLRLAYGKLTLLEGPPDVGKSTIALDLAARLTSGRPMPGEERGRDPQSVAILAAEDSFGDSVRPRLLAAGADPERVFLLRGIIEVDLQENVTFPKGISALTDLFENHEIKLAILDPFLAFFGTLNCYHDQHVRRGLSPLVEAARDYAVALLAIRNWTKDDRRNLLYRGSGALGIVNSARTTLAVLPDPVEPDVGVLRVVKSNLARKPADLRFALEDTGRAARVNWLGTAPNTDGQQSAFRQACDFLKEVLAAGPMHAATAVTLAHQNGISKRTLQKAKAVLGVRSRFFHENGTRWEWELAPTPQGCVVARASSPCETHGQDAHATFCQPGPQ